jgi:hypothetical protein
MVAMDFDLIFEGLAKDAGRPETETGKEGKRDDGITVRDGDVRFSGCRHDSRL